MLQELRQRLNEEMNKQAAMFPITGFRSMMGNLMRNKLFWGGLGATGAVLGGKALVNKAQQAGQGLGVQQAAPVDSLMQQNQSTFGTPDSTWAGIRLPQWGR